MNSFIRIFIALCLSFSGFIFLTKVIKLETYQSFAMIAFVLLCIVLYNYIQTHYNKSVEKAKYKRCVARIERRLAASVSFNDKMDRFIKEVETTMEEGEMKQELLELLNLLKANYAKLMDNLPQGEKAVDVRTIALELVPVLFDNYQILSYPTKLSLQNSFIHQIRKIRQKVNQLSHQTPDC